MKIKYFVILLSICSVTSIFSQALPEPEKPLCSKAQCGLERGACSCYCSIKCGPRKIQPEDTPKYDEATGQCFCRPRDKMLYEINGCNVKEAAAKY